MLRRLRGVRDRVIGRPSVDWYRRHGCRLGDGVEINFGCLLDPTHCWLIEIGDGTVLAPNVLVLAHDASTKRELGHTRVYNTRIGSGVFLGANCVVLPGVTVGDGAIVGAGTVIPSDVPAGAVVVGNPARVVGTAADYIARQQAALARLPVFGSGWTTATGITAARKKEMADQLGAEGGFVW